jgi:hypothetical protein
LAAGLRSQERARCLNKTLAPHFIINFFDDQLFSAGKWELFAAIVFHDEILVLPLAKKAVDEYSHAN